LLLSSFCYKFHRTDREIILGLPLILEKILDSNPGRRVKMVENSRSSIQIDLNEFKLHLHLKGKTQLTLHFNSPSRRFYLSVIVLVVSEMKRLGKIKFIPLQEHLDLLALLNETIGGAAGSSEKENLLHRIYAKWKNALPNLEDAPLFRVLGKKKEEGEEAIGRSYALTDAEKDGWANLFEYRGSNEFVRLKFAIDKIGISLDETSIKTDAYFIDGKFQPDKLIAPHILKKICPPILFCIGQCIAPPDGSLSLFFFLPKNFEKRGILQVREGVLLDKIGIFF